MSKQSERSSRAKTKKHMKTSKKNKIIIIISVVVLVLVCFCYFAYVTGLPAKVLPGAKIVHTVDGKEKTVDRISIVEMNYYYSTTLSQYTSYGIIGANADLDAVYNSNNGQTYRQMLWETAANNAQTQYLLGEAIKSSGFKPVAAERYAEDQLDSIRESADYMNTLRGTNMTTDQYLQNMYGPGMTVQIMRKILYRQAMIDEFRAYVQQTTFLPDQAKVQEEFDNNKDKYTFCRFQIYFVSADMPTDATDEQKKELMDAAMEKAKMITDDCANAVEFQTKVKLVCTDEYRTRMLNGEDPTSKSGMNKEQLKSYSEEFAEMCFNPETKPNTSMVFVDKDNTGVFATLFEEVYIEDEPTCAYRVLSLTDDVLGDISNTLEQKAPSHQKLHAEAEGYMSQVTSEDKFIELVKKYSSDSASYLAGGYKSGVKASSFEANAVVTKEGEEAKLPEEDQKLIDWLYDPARKKGDMYIIDCVDSVKLYYFCDSMAAYQDLIRTNLTGENFTTWYNATISDSSYSTVVNHGLIDFFT